MSQSVMLKNGLQNYSTISDFRKHTHKNIYAVLEKYERKQM